MAEDIKNLLIISLHADPSMPPGIGTYGGGHLYPKELLIGLSNRGYRISLITRKSYEDLPAIEQLTENSTIYRLDYGNYGLFDKRMLYELRGKSLELAMFITTQYQIKPDIIHSIYWNSGQLAIELARQWNVPFVHSIISNGKKITKTDAKEIAPLRLEIESEIFKHASYLLCITNSERMDLMHDYGVHPRKIMVIGRPVHEAYMYPAHDEFGRSREEGKERRIYRSPLYAGQFVPDGYTLWWNKTAFTYVGRLDLNKGIDKIIQSWLLLYNKYGTDCPPLWIVGGTPQEINDLHYRLGLDLHAAEKTGKLLWWGYLDPQGISALYLRSRALIMHSKYEPGGRVTIEAMSEGLPVIATNCGFAGDMIKDWENGFLVPYGDVEQLAKRMDHFIVQPYLSNCLGLLARETAKEITASWNFTDTHIEAYRKALSFPARNNLQSVSGFNEAVDRIHTYPVSSSKAEMPILLDFLKKANAGRILDIKPEPAVNHRYKWRVKTMTRELYIVQPYSNISLNPFYTTKVNWPLIHFAQDEYKRERFCSKLLPTNALFFDRSQGLILYRHSWEAQFNESQFRQGMEFIAKCQETWAREVNGFSKELNDLLSSSGVAAVLERYLLKYSRTPWRVDEPFSSRAECKLLISELANGPHSELSARLSRLDQRIVEEDEWVLSGIAHDGCLGSDKNGNIVLVSCRYLHLAWPGEDYARLLLKVAGDSLIPAKWASLAERLPSGMGERALIWCVVLLGKQAVLNERMFSANSDTEALFSQVNILLDLLGIPIRG